MVEQEVEYEVIDKSENKRLNKKMKERASSTSDDDGKREGVFRKEKVRQKFNVNEKLPKNNQSLEQILASNETLCQDYQKA